MLGVLLFDTLPGLMGLMLGIGVSMLLLVHRSSRPHIATLINDGEHRVDIAAHPHTVDPNPGVLAVRVESGLYFANADFLRIQLEQRCTTTTQLIVCQVSPFIDVSAARM